MIRSVITSLSIIVVLILMSLSSACGSKEEPSTAQTSPSAAQPVSGESVTVDMSVPEGPLQAIFQAGRTKNYELYRSAFSDAVPPEAVSQQRFNGFVKRVNDGTLAIIPGIEKISETEATVKMRNTKRNRDRQFRVRKIGDRWFIVGIVDEGQRARQREESEDL